MHSISSGVWPTMVTPYNKDNEIDFSAVERLLEFYRQRGVTGVFAVCQSSEMFQLSREEKSQLIRHIVSHAGDLQVIVSGHTASSLDEQISEAMELTVEGVSAYVILPNRFADADESDDQLIAKMKAFLSEVPSIPLGIYECPYPYKRLLTPKVLYSCVESDRFLFIKDTCCRVEQIAEKLKIIAGTGIKLFNANSATLLESLRMGADGYSGVMANFHPEFYSWLCHSYQTDLQLAEQVQQFLGVCSMAEYQSYPVNAKFALSLQGVSMEIFSRMFDADLFTESQRLEIQQLVQLSSLAHDFFQITSH